MSIGAHSVRENCAHSDLPDGALANACVGDYIALLVGLELLDGELSRLTLAAYSLVDTSICSAANEADDLVLVHDSNLGLVACLVPAVGRICIQSAPLSFNLLTVLDSSER